MPCVARLVPAHVAILSLHFFFLFVSFFFSFFFGVRPPRPYLLLFISLLLFVSFLFLSFCFFAVSMRPARRVLLQSIQIESTGISSNLSIGLSVFDRFVLESTTLVCRFFRNHQRIPINFSAFDWVLLGFYQVLLGFT